MALVAIGAAHVLDEPKIKPQPLATLQVRVADLHAGWGGIGGGGNGKAGYRDAAPSIKRNDFMI